VTNSLYYHFCLLVLFRSYRHIPFSDPDIYPAKICAEAGAAIIGLAESCINLGQRHLSCFVPLFVYAAGLLEADEDICRHQRVALAGNMSSSSVKPDQRACEIPEESGLSPYSVAPCQSPQAPSVRGLAERTTALLGSMYSTYPCAQKLKAQLHHVLSNSVDNVTGAEKAR
jgi:hypothetical protein